MMSPLETLNNMTWVIPYPTRDDARRLDLGRLEHLASGVCHRARRLLARNKRQGGEDVVGVGLGRVSLADEDIGHQLVVAGTIAHLARLQRDLRWQLQVLKRLRHLRTLQ